MDRRALGLVLSAVLALLAMSPAQAQDAFEQGTKNFKAKKYALAAQAFKKAVAENSSNPTPYYYYALSLHYAKDMKAAKQEYGRIISYFPLSDAARYARQALAQLDPAYLKQIDPNYNPAAAAQQAAQPARPTSAAQSSPASSGGSNSSAGFSSKYDSIPDECRVYYTKVGNSLELDCSFNNRPHKVIFDTGASATVLGKNHLAEMGIPAPQGEADDESYGVGSATANKVWSMRMDVKVGNILRRNFPVSVQESLAEPLLGQTFFQEFNYTIDNGANSIAFTKKGAKTASGSIYAGRDPNAVAFVRRGRHIVVSAEINGKKSDMIFDTGAEACAFDRKQVADLGIQIPADAVNSSNSGVSGVTHSKIFPIGSLKLGPIEKRDFEITVLESANMPLPLLGQEFFGGWQYTVDDQAGLIRFVRR